MGVIGLWGFKIYVSEHDNRVFDANKNPFLVNINLLLRMRTRISQQCGPNIHILIFQADIKTLRILAKSHINVYTDAVNIRINSVNPLITSTDTSSRIT